MNKHFKFILEKYPLTRVFRRFEVDGEIFSTKWLTAIEWIDKHKKDPTDYVILGHEIVLETDFTTKEANQKYYEKYTKPFLQSKNFGYITCFSGGKSFHTHICFDKFLDRYQKEKLVELWFTPEHQYDKQLFYGEHGIRLIGAKHPNTGLKKEIVDRFDKENKIDLSIIPQKKPFVPLGKPISIKLNECAILRSSLTRKFPTGARNSVLIPNLIASDPTEDEIEAFCKIQEIPRREIESWQRSKKFQRVFSCKQLRYMYSEFAEECADMSCKKYHELLEKRNNPI